MFSFVFIYFSRREIMNFSLFSGGGEKKRSFYVLKYFDYDRFKPEILWDFLEICKSVKSLHTSKKGLWIIIKFML